MRQQENKKRTKEHSGMELLRVIATFLVVFIHSSSEAFFRFNQSWFSVDIAASLSRVSVPVFFLIAGYFAFTGKNGDSIIAFLIKKFNRLIIPLIAWSFFYLYYNNTPPFIRCGIKVNVHTSTLSSVVFLHTNTNRNNNTFAYQRRQNGGKKRYSVFQYSLVFICFTSFFH